MSVIKTQISHLFNCAHKGLGKSKAAERLLQTFNIGKSSNIEENY